MVKGYSDYFPEAPGGRASGRSCEPRPFDARALGDDLATLHPPYMKVPLNMVVQQSDYRWLSTGIRHWRGPVRMLRVGMRSLAARARRKKLIGLGPALMAELMLGVRDAGVTVELGTRLVDLVTDSDRVVGVRLESGECRPPCTLDAVSSSRVAGSTTTTTCEASTSAGRVARSGLSGHRPIPGTVSVQLYASTPQFRTWTTRGGPRRFHCPKARGSPWRNARCLAASWSTPAVGAS